MSAYIDPYAQAINPTIDCGDCKAACCRLTVILSDDDHVPEWLIDHGKSGVDILRKGDDGRCAAVDRRTSRCTIYAQRPELCRKFAMGGPGCRFERWAGRHAPFPTPVVLIDAYSNRR